MVECDRSYETGYMHNHARMYVAAAACNVDPNWRNGVKANRILLLESSHFEKYRVSQKVMDFLLALAKNIDGIHLYVGDFAELIESHGPLHIYYN